jgi:tetratricopeptide (TPR) repeat protein
MNSIFKLQISALCLAASVCFASNDETLVRPIQEQWAEIKYRQDAKQQASGYHALAVQAKKMAGNHPGKAEPLIWEGIALSSEAGVVGGLGALSLAKEAKHRFEQAIALDSTALDGSAYTSLATLYAKVPGWPLGFGNTDKADELFKKSLAINPQGIDANFFYAEFLATQGQAAQAMKHLDAALKAVPRPGRALADQGRRLEVESLKKNLAP